MSGAQTANNVQHGNVVSRLSKVQREILAYLATTPQPVAGNIAKLPRTGDIIDGLGRARSPSNYAVVSRALKRLEQRGLISSFASIICTRGKGMAYAIRLGEQYSARYGGERLILNRPKPRAPRHYTGVTIEA